MTGRERATASRWLAAAALVLVPVQQAAADLVSHRAAYRLTLASTGGAGALTAVNGALVIEWKVDCTGWLSQQRLGFKAETEEGPGFSYDVRFSSWESPDNKSLRFTMRSFDDGQPGDSFEGRAALSGPGGSGEARYTTPNDETLQLPPGTVFPTEHLRQLLAAAHKGVRLVTHSVFDGSGREALNRVTAVIGDPRAKPNARQWPVALAYYQVDTAEELPEFEIAFDLGEDGILHELELSYPDFALRGDLEEVEHFDPPRCD